MRLLPSAHLAIHSSIHSSPYFHALTDLTAAPARHWHINTELKRGLSVDSRLVWFRAVPPDASSPVYTKRQLSLRDWTKVLAWARSMEAIARTAKVSTALTLFSTCHMLLTRGNDNASHVVSCDCWAS